jgi:urea transporter
MPVQDAQWGERRSGATEFAVVQQPAEGEEGASRFMGGEEGPSATAMTELPDHPDSTTQRLPPWHWWVFLFLWDANSWNDYPDKWPYWVGYIMRSAQFVFAFSRSVSQVYIWNNPWTGLLMVISSGAVAPQLVILALVAMSTSMLTAYTHNRAVGEITAGLWGFNGFLVGAAVSVFVGDAYYHGFFLALIGGVVVTYIQIINAIVLALFPSPQPPVATLAFNVTAIFLVLSLYRFNALSPSLSIADSPWPADDAGLEGNASPLAVIGWGSLRGVTQVMFVENAWVAVIYILAAALYSPIAALASLWGSCVSTTTAVLLGLPSNLIAAGLFGYNGCLLYCAIFATFLTPSLSSFLLAFMACILLVPLQLVLSPLAFTLPFVILTVGLLIALQYAPLITAIISGSRSKFNGIWMISFPPNIRSAEYCLWQAWIVSTRRDKVTDHDNNKAEEVDVEQTDAMGESATNPDQENAHDDGNVV